MKQWFPFADYDFYAYLTSGLIALAALDYVLTDGHFLLKTDWPIIHVIFAISAAYIAGHIMAGPSSMLLENGLARRLLHSPVALQLGVRRPRLAERLIHKFAVGRYYSALPKPVRNQIFANVASRLGADRIKEPEAIFQIAFPVARSIADTANRLDQFRNQYGFCRNVAFSFLLAAAVLTPRVIASGEKEVFLGVTALLALAVAMFFRFLKFYAAFSAEVLRTFAHIDTDKKEKTHEHSHL